jgi:hypothetical protein
MMKRGFKIVIEKDEDGVFIATAPELKGCHSYGKTMEIVGHLNRSRGTPYRFLAETHMVFLMAREHRPPLGEKPFLERVSTLLGRNLLPSKGGRPKKDKS